MSGAVSGRPLIVVARIADLPVPYTPAEPSTCSECGAPVWLGYAVRADVPFGIPVCWPCAEPRIIAEGVVLVPPEVRREAAEYLRTRGLVS